MESRALMRACRNLFAKISNSFSMAAHIIIKLVDKGTSFFEMSTNILAKIFVFQ